MEENKYKIGDSFETLKLSVFLENEPLSEDVLSFLYKNKENYYICKVVDVLEDGRYVVSLSESDDDGSFDCYEKLTGKEIKKIKSDFLGNDKEVFVLYEEFNENV